MKMARWHGFYAYICVVKTRKMRTITIISVLLLAPVCVLAQGVERGFKAMHSEVCALDGDTLAAPAEIVGMTPTRTYDATAAMPVLPSLVPADTLHLPTLNMHGQVPSVGAYPLMWGGWRTWDLHQGLNLNVGASVFAQFGKHARHGAGFAQSVSMMYAMPLGSRMSLAVGGYLDNVYWAHDSYRDAGLSAVLGYRFNDHWEAYLYGQKSLTNSRLMPPALSDMSEVGDRIGAAVRYNFSNNASIQISVEGSSRPAPKQYILEPPAGPAGR